MSFAVAIHTTETPGYRSIDSRGGLCAARNELDLIAAPRRNRQLVETKAVLREPEVEI